MPDVFTHLMVGASIALLVRRDDNRKEQMLVVLGAVLIDIERPFSWLLTGTELEWLELGSAFHSIIGAIVLAYVVATFFETEHTKLQARFGLILVGCASHLLLDLVMYPWTEMGLYLLYPLKLAFSFNLLWPDFWWYPVFGVASLFVSLCIRFLMTLRQFDGTESGT